MKRDPLLWAALAAALAVTASAEYALARHAGFGTYVAAGVPAALDIYAVRALRARRDVAAAVLAMIAVNSAAHLVAAGLLPVSMPLVVAVSAIAPLVLWRVHRLADPAHRATEPEGMYAPPPAVVHTPPEVHTAATLTPPAELTAAVPAPQVICGAQQVFTLAVHPSPEVDTAEPGRLTAEQARTVIEAAWVNGEGVREAARLATRSPSYVSKVYDRLEAERARQATGEQLALAGA